MMQALPALHHQKPQVLSYMRWRSIRLMPVELFLADLHLSPADPQLRFGHGGSSSIARQSTEALRASVSHAQRLGSRQPDGRQSRVARSAVHGVDVDLRLPGSR